MLPAADYGFFSTGNCGNIRLCLLHQLPEYHQILFIVIHSKDPYSLKCNLFLLFLSVIALFYLFRVCLKIWDPYNECCALPYFTVQL